MIALLIDVILLGTCWEAMLELVLKLPLKQHLPVELLLNIHLDSEVHLLFLEMLFQLILDIVPRRVGHVGVTCCRFRFDLTT